MRCVLVANGNMTGYQFHAGLFMPDDTIICCDGGMRHLRALGKQPTIIIGDLDSASMADRSYFKSVPVKKYPADKNETDLELALQYAIKMQPDEIIMLGVIGSRFDHTLANVYLLIQAMDAGIRATIMDEHNRIMLTRSTISISGNKGDLVSLIALSEVVTGITTNNLAYALDGFTFEAGTTRGISNVMLGESASVSVATGSLLVIQSSD